MSTRRHFLGQLAGAAGITGVAALGLASLPAPAKAATGGWRMPDEHGAQDRVFLAYAAQPQVWGEQADAVNATVARLARTLARYQPVSVLCRPAQRRQARDRCGTDNIELLEVALDDIWVRDYGGCFVVDGQGGLGLVDVNFNGWGGKQRARNDGAVAAWLAEVTGATLLGSDLVGEGGGIEVDGQGTAVLTESCWVNRNRNPGWSRADIEAELKHHLGLRKIIWLPGIAGQDITDAHVDFYARFVQPGVVVANLDNDAQSYDYDLTREHLQILRTATDADGRPLQVHVLPPPLHGRDTVHMRDNEDMARGYINYLPVNGAVIAPQFGDAQADGHCRELLQDLYPGRRIEQLDIDAIAAGGGGIHCVTKNMPRVD
ncbi:agmatine deiminase family protein [Stenotrophomonas sp. 24(2023)]|uniref:agmatine deiminase family protein n=1 Tax=Stenotrophomonas sp. 24(2023) TaxID=3068324 RepID=UPI0027E07249|nr:agmatine deiminase family protein [Stenotrophomonas sp. 24(2023)]WMJ69686.1 agmatine deiminase family protein [Stenotrophomonas sp. 24(2023)]